MRSIRICFLFVSLAAFCAIAGCSGGGGGTAAASTNGSNSGGGSTSDGSGGETIPSGTAKLSWEAPLGDDGTPATGVAGYKISYGAAPGAYDSTVDVGAVTACTVGGLAPGTYYFAVKCYDSSGNESPYSNEAAKTIQ